MMRELTRYVGIPYLDKGTDPARGLDCWQLVRYFYAQEFGLQVPDYMAFYHSSLSMHDAMQAIARGISDWVPAAPPAFGDVIVFRISGAPWHTGVRVDDGMMLHTDEGHGSVIETINGTRWRDRFYGAYKWKS